MIALYNVLLYLLAPLWAPWLYWNARKRELQPNWSERWGRYARANFEGAAWIWVHAVSVGEVMATVPVLEQLRLTLPKYKILLTCTTSSGFTAAEGEAQKFAGKPFPLYDRLAYAPLDFRPAAKQAMKAVAPRALILMETEIWPNLIDLAKAGGAETFIANARLSDRSFPRALKLKRMYRAVLSRLTAVLAQTEEDSRRFVALGAPLVEVVGNTKFDQAAPSPLADPETLKSEYGITPGEFCIVVGSTRGQAETEFVADALASLKAQISDVQVVWAPRHIEMAQAVSNALTARFMQSRFRSKGQKGSVLILDTYGELAAAYSIADVVVVGGGFDDLGGQNIIQPMACGKPILHGPHMANFRAVAAEAEREGSTRVVESPKELADNLKQLWDSPDERKAMGESAEKLFLKNLGAARRYADRIALFVSFDSE